MTRSKTLNSASSNSTLVDSFSSSKLPPSKIPALNTIDNLSKKSLSHKQSILIRSIYIFFFNLNSFVLKIYFLESLSDFQQIGYNKKKHGFNGNLHEFDKKRSKKLRNSMPNSPTCLSPVLPNNTFKHSLQAFNYSNNIKVIF